MVHSETSGLMAASVRSRRAENDPTDARSTFTQLSHEVTFVTIS